MKPIELNTNHIIDIANWYAIEGINNWGCWGNYPSLPVGASYHSFDTCPLRITLDSPVTYKGYTFNCISDKRRVPGKNLEVIRITSLVNLLKKEGIEFEGPFMTKEKAQELKAEEIRNLEETIENIKNLTDESLQHKQAREQIQQALDHVIIPREKGQQLPETIANHNITIRNYALEEEATFVVNLSLLGKNSKNTTGTYKAESVDIEEAVKRFAKEKVDSYKKVLKHHSDRLSALKQNKDKEQKPKGISI